MAVEGGSRSLVSLLIDRGADVRAANNVRTHSSRILIFNVLECLQSIMTHLFDVINNDTEGPWIEDSSFKYNIPQFIFLCFLSPYSLISCSSDFLVFLDFCCICDSPIARGYVIELRCSVWTHRMYGSAADWWGRC